MYTTLMRRMYSAKDIPVSMRGMFARDIIDKIITRTQQGLDINGRPFVSYKDSYRDSDVFKSMGKTGHVNLTLFSEMLNSIEYDTQGDNVVIYINDSTEAAKAYNHNTGDTLPRREFFGVTQSELDTIKKQYKQISDSPQMIDLLNEILTPTIDTEVLDEDI